MGAVHHLIEAHGKSGALQLDLDRRVVEAVGSCPVLTSATARKSTELGGVP